MDPLSYQKRENWLGGAKPFNFSKKGAEAPFVFLII
jgi:hypothetical protein